MAGVNPYITPAKAPPPSMKYRLTILPEGKVIDLPTLVKEMADKKIDALLILGGNPAYTATADIDFAGALKNVGFKLHLGSHNEITCGANCEAAEQHGRLCLPCADEQVADPPDEHQAQHGGDAPQHPAFEAQPQEVTLELTGDIGLLGADEVQHLDDSAVARHRAPGREGDRQHRCGQHEKQDAHPGGDGGFRHPAHAADPGAVVVEAGAGDLLRQRSAQRHGVDAGAPCDPDGDHPRHRQVFERHPGT